MSVIDPESPLDSTTCGCCGQALELGGLDCVGTFIGYLTEGCAWEDRREHDVAIGSGRAFDAWKAWVWNACLGPEPELLAIIREHCSPVWEDDALRECGDLQEWFAHPDAIRRRAARASLN